MNIRKIFSVFDISASGMRAQRQRMNAIASNIANIETTQTENGEPYRRKVVVMNANNSGGGFKQVLKREDQRIKITDPRHIRTVRKTNHEDGVGVSVESKTTTVQENAFNLTYDPDHPDSDENGYVRIPNINIINEMVDMITASRSYEANATSIEANKAMVKKALKI